MENNYTYSKEFLEENLPDYLFGKLSESESQIFEKEIQNYPDLVELAENLKNSYLVLKKEEINQKLESDSLEISAEVMHAWNYGKNGYTLKMLTKSFVWSVSAAAVIFFVYLILPDSFWNKNVIEKNQNHSKLFTINADEMNELEEDDVLESAMSGFTESSNPATNEEKDMLSEVSENNYNNILNDADYAALKMNLIPTYNYDKSINSYLDLNNEEDLETILQEIQNVNI